ncbi:MAG: hypothetical protein U0894_16340 [Pirellulales bacterium]
MRLVEWQELHRQLVEMAEGVGYSVGKRQITFSEFLPPSEEDRKGRINTSAQILFASFALGLVCFPMLPVSPRETSTLGQGITSYSCGLVVV